jgi:hypothetical protein
VAIRIAGITRKDADTVEPVSVAVLAPPAAATAAALAPTVAGSGDGPDFPDETNTGVPSGVTLQLVPDDVASGDGWVWNAGGWVDITGDGTVFDSFEVNASVNVMGAGCTVSKCSVSNRGNDNGIAIRHANDTLVENCTVIGSDTPGAPDDNRLTIGIKDVFGDVNGTIVRGCNISGCSAGIAIDDGLIEGNYIHDFSYAAADHVDALQSFSVSSLSHTVDGQTWVGLKISGNTLLNQLGQTACILISTTLESPQGNKLVTGNLMAGGGYCISGPGGDAAGDSHDLVIVDNQISTRFFDTGGDFGPASHFHTGTDWPGNEWSGNTWADGPSVGEEIAL